MTKGKRWKIRKHNSGYPLALHQNKITANKSGNTKMLKNGNIKQASSLSVCGSEKGLRVTILCQISPCCFHWLLDFPHMQEPDHNDSRDRAKEATARITSCTLQFPFIVLFPERAPSSWTCSIFTGAQYKDNCFLEQFMNMATEWAAWIPAWKNKITSGVFKITQLTVQHHWNPFLGNPGFGV